MGMGGGQGEAYEHTDQSLQQHPQAGPSFDLSLRWHFRGFIPWLQTQKDHVVQKSTKFHDILIPTKDTIRSMWLVEHLLTQRQHVLCVGPTGVSGLLARTWYLPGDDGTMRRAKEQGGRPPPSALLPAVSRAQLPLNPS